MISGLASRSINGWSDRLFRANHPVSRDDASIPDISFPAVNSTTIRTQLVRILHLRYKKACFPWKNEWFTATLATHWTTHQGPRQRTRRRSTCRHGHAWIGTESQSNWPNMRKTLGKPGFLSGEDRNRTTREIPRNGAFHYPARREIRRAQKTPLKTTRNGIATNHRSPR
jgi:hypothetical protein